MQTSGVAPGRTQQGKLSTTCKPKRGIFFQGSSNKMPLFVIDEVLATR
ncbi:MAG TPA: hypothetical protein VGK55_07675 [Actinomycetes bacterium]|jgi:hypothetical protein